MSLAVEAQGLTKRYSKYGGGKARLRAMLGMSVQGPHFEALAPVSFTIDKGEAVGLIGTNGSGKSTLLKILAGVAAPTAGQAHIHGRVGALLELGTGFHPEFTGRQNMVHAGLLAGFSREEIERITPEVIDFSELAHAIDDPLKTYSTGMKMRLGFAVAHALHPEVLLVDEVLAVGDVFFKYKCYDRLESFVESGGTFILVSHELSSILRMCKRVIWIEQGHLQADGPTAEVLDKYQHHIMSLEEKRIFKAASAVAESDSLPESHVAKVHLRDDTGAPRHYFRPQENVDVVVEVTAHETLENASVRLVARRRDNLCLLDSRCPAQTFAPGTHQVVASFAPLELGPCELFVTASLEVDGEVVHSSAEPTPAVIVAPPDDVFERGGVRHYATWVANNTEELS